MKRNTQKMPLTLTCKIPTLLFAFMLSILCGQLDCAVDRRKNRLHQSAYLLAFEFLPLRSYLLDLGFIDLVWLGLSGASVIAFTKTFCGNQI